MATPAPGPSRAETTESFPALETTETVPTSPPNSGGIFSFDRLRQGADWLLEQEIPRGASQAFAQSVAQAPTISEIKQGALTTTGEERYLQFENGDTPADLQRRRRETSWDSRRGSRVTPSGRASVPLTPAASSPTSPELITSSIPENNSNNNIAPPSDPSSTEKSIPAVQKTPSKPSPLTRFDTVNSLHLTPSGTFPNGYKFPPKHTWKEATAIGFKAFIRFSFGSIFGFLLLIYALNVVAWGGMIFLLLCGAGNKYMCTGYYVDHCNSTDAKKSFWIEVDAQVLTALFCVTAFGLLPWRGRDFYYLMQYRLQHKHIALRKLAAAHKGWFRLPGSHHLDPLVKIPNPPDSEAEQYLPFPLEKGAEAPLTGIRALSTPLWKMDFVVWMFMLNSIIQIPLDGVMWGMTRFNRPSWVTALLIVIGMLSAMAAGILQLIESKKIKAREGIPLTKAEIGPDMAADLDVEKGLEMQSGSEVPKSLENVDISESQPGKVTDKETV